MLDRVDAATRRLLRSVKDMPEPQLSGASGLPGWTRGHVLTHVARNADSLVNLATWARTGVETPQYPSQEIRDRDIERGAGRPLVEQLADLTASAQRLAEAWQTLPEDRHDFPVRKRGGDTMPAREILWARMREVEIHHVDARIGYAPQDWPERFVAQLLPEVVATFAARRGEGPDGFTVRATDLDVELPLGGRAFAVTGPAAELVAWLTGRSAGTALRIDPADEPAAGPPPQELPQMGAWR